MRVLVACEFSGTVRRAFRALGHDAWSCDILPTEDGSRYHYQRDVRKVLRLGWDLMIAHPPCTYLASSGLHWNKRRPGRDRLTLDAIDFFLELLCAPIPRMAIENPIGALSSHIQRPNQIIDPSQFGHRATKATCLWLIGLPPLVPTRIMRKNLRGECWLTPPGPDRWKIRSKTYPGIAAAMASQWSQYIMKPQQPTLQYIEQFNRRIAA